LNPGKKFIGKELQTMLVGVDTGFFYNLKEGNRLAQKVWQASDVTVSVITIFELEKHSLKSPTEHWQRLFMAMKEACFMVPVSLEISLQAARIAHGTGIPSLDSIILASLLSAGCRKIYTSDTHFLLYQKAGIRINLL